MNDTRITHIDPRQPSGALLLPLMDASVRCGFPSPAEDAPGKLFDLMEYIAPRPVTTFVMRVSGDSMQDAGIRDGSLIAVDRSLQARHGDIVVAVVDGDFTVKQLYQREGRCELHAANDAYPHFTFTDGHTLEVWGVVTACVTPFIKHPGHKRSVLNNTDRTKYKP